MDAEISQQTPILRSYYQIRDKKRMHIEFAKESSNSKKEPEGSNLNALIVKRMIQNSEGKPPKSLIMEKEVNSLTASPTRENIS